MAGLLANIFSAGDTAKRKLRGLLGDPVGTVTQFVNNENDRAGRLKELTYEAAMERRQRVKGGDLFGMGPKETQLTGLLADAYNPTGMFIGATAKTWDKAAAEKAQKLLKAGADPKQVWKETGTFKGADGALRQEIPDVRAGMRLEGPKFGTSTMDKMGEVLDHRDLYKAYPDTANINATWSDATSGGSYHAPRSWAEYINLPQGAKKDLKRSTSLHEIQHAIQQREGWARGGSPESMALDQVIDPRFSEGLTRWNKTIGKYGYPKDKMFQPDDIKMNDPELLMRELQGQARWLEDGMGKYVPDFDNAFPPGVTPFSLNAEEAYRRLAGEAEARATQARMNMNAAQRREVYPFDSYDVPVDQLIVRGLLK